MLPHMLGLAVGWELCIGKYVMKLMVVCERYLGRPVGLPEPACELPLPGWGHWLKLHGISSILVDSRAFVGFRRFWTLGICVTLEPKALTP